MIEEDRRENKDRWGKKDRWEKGNGWGRKINEERKRWKRDKVWKRNERREWMREKVVDESSHFWTTKNTSLKNRWSFKFHSENKSTFKLDLLCMYAMSMPEPPNHIWNFANYIDMKTFHRISSFEFSELKLHLDFF